MPKIHITEHGKQNPGLRKWKARIWYEDYGYSERTGEHIGTNNATLLVGAIDVLKHLPNKQTHVELTSNAMYLITSINCKLKSGASNYELRKELNKEVSAFENLCASRMSRSILDPEPKKKKPRSKQKAHTKKKYQTNSWAWNPEGKKIVGRNW